GGCGVPLGLFVMSCHQDCSGARPATSGYGLDLPARAYTARCTRGSTRGWIGAMCPTLHVLRAVSIGQRPAEAVQWSAVHTGARSLMDRASDYGSEGWGFESLRARKTEAPPPASGDGAL